MSVLGGSMLKPTLPTTCAGCGLTFARHIYRRTQRYCSRACACANRYRPAPPIYLAERDTYLLTLEEGVYAEIDAIDVDLAAFKWSVKRGKSGVQYASRRVLQSGREVTVFLHRVILERKLGHGLDSSDYTDHRDRNGLNDKRSNLRRATQSQNMANTKTPVTNTSGAKGVSYDRLRGKWAAYITQGCRRRFLGRFATKAEAHKVRLDAARDLFGEFINSEETA